MPSPGNGAGSFAAAVNFAVVAAAAVNFAVGTNPRSVISGDFNGDGKADLAVSNYSSNNVSILIGNGAGSFAAAVNFAVGTNPRSVISGDFNGDGKADLAVANVSSNNVSILIGNGAGNFGAAVTCYYVEGTTFYLGFRDGTFRVMDASNTNLSITGSSNFLSRVTDFKKINGVYFICLANGAIIKVNGAGTGANCFALSHQGHHFETICGWNYYIGDMDFDEINANRMANSPTKNPLSNSGQVKPLATASINSNKTGLNSLDAVSISPNPNNGNFAITGQDNSSGQLYISVTDGQGRLIKQETIYNIGDEINFSYLEGGAYYLNIRSSVSTISPTVKKLFINK